MFGVTIEKKNVVLSVEGWFSFPIEKRKKNKIRNIFFRERKRDLKERG